MNLKGLTQKPAALLTAGIGIGLVVAFAVGIPLVLMQSRRGPAADVPAADVPATDAPATDGPTNAEPASPEPANPAPSNPDATSPDAEQAAARAAWEEQQRHVQSILQPMDRAELVGESPTRGNSEASVVVVKFSDFQCPYCAVASSVMKAFVGRHEDEVLYVYKHFPLDSIHPEATPAAKATWAAQQQGQF
ncbi:MAG: thioredoxin domain-containing protein, partial [Cyanobacteria bacterium P01_A01_bin.105]